MKLDPRIQSLIDAITRWQGPMRDDHTLCRAAEKALPALRALPSQPEDSSARGVVVPRELTRQMAEALELTDGSDLHKDGLVGYYQPIWDAVLAAAPQQNAAQGSERGRSEREERLFGIVLAAHRAFSGGSDYVKQEAKRLCAAEIETHDNAIRAQSAERDSTDGK